MQNAASVGLGAHPTFAASRSGVGAQLCPQPYRFAKRGSDILPLWVCYDPLHGIIKQGNCGGETDPNIILANT